MKFKSQKHRKFSSIQGRSAARRIFGIAIVCLFAAATLAGSRAIFRTLGIAEAGSKGESSSPGRFGPTRNVGSLGQSAKSGDGVWAVTSASGAINVRAESAQITGGFQSAILNRPNLEAILGTAPNESVKDALQNAPILELPLPGGGFESFRILESPMFEAGLATAHPELKTYSIISVDHPATTGRLSWTSVGLDAIVLTPTGTYFVSPADNSTTTNYVSFYSKDVERTLSFLCGSDSKLQEIAETIKGQTTTALNATSAPTFGANLRTYRLAVAATAEFTQQWGGGNVNTTLSVITAIVNDINAIYGRDLAVRLNLVANETAIIFTDANTDGYTNGNPTTMVSENQAKLDATITDAAYDIGHVFGGLAVGVNSYQFAGFANIGIVCQSGLKGRGATAMGDGTDNAFFRPQIVGGIAHEMGHQFGAHHTYNATTNSFCGSQRDGNHAVEPGSGSTIMSYSLCSDGSGTENLQRFDDNYFHAHSIQEITDYITANSCAVNVATGNTPPVINAGPNYTIPALTPFALTAAATDVNGDPLTYTWEENDPAGSHLGPPNTDDGFKPIFRSRPPSASPTRFFPSLIYILNNANQPPITYIDNTPPFAPDTFLTGESLPTTTRPLNFKATVRDNHPGGGGIDTGAVTLSVVNTGSGFAVTSPNTAISAAGGSPLTVTWNVAGTTANGINTANVKISLSTDGGNSFPIVLAASTANDGAETVTVPTITTGTTTARIKVEAVGNIFFDISDANFTLTPGTATCTFTLSSTTLNIGTGGGAGNTVNVSSQTLCAWTAVSNDSFITVTGGAAGTGDGTVTFSVAANPGVQRTGTLTIAGQTFTVTQAAFAPASVGFSLAAFTGSEAATNAVVTVLRSGDTSGVSTVNYATSDTAGTTNCNVVNGIASSRCDYTGVIGTLTFAAGETSKTITIPVINDSYAEGNESFSITLSGATGATLGTSTATVTITDNENVNGVNPVDDKTFFIRQQYLDFLGREPDPGGLAFYLNILNGCVPTDVECNKYTRGALSANFFRSPEFQRKGSYVMYLYMVSLGQRPATVAELGDASKIDRPHYNEFITDLASISDPTDDPAIGEAKKVAFTDAWLVRPEIQAKYPSSLTNAQFVQRLQDTAGVTVSIQAQLVNNLNAGTMTRAQALRAIVESPEVNTKFYKQAFVTMEYFGYLRRDPEICVGSSDPSACGYIFHNNRFQLVADEDFLENTIVRGFIESPEYRGRFGP